MIRSLETLMKLNASDMNYQDWNELQIRDYEWRLEHAFNIGSAEHITDRLASLLLSATHNFYVTYVSPESFPEYNQ